MTSQVDTKKTKKLPGDSLIGIGVGLFLIAIFMGVMAGSATAALLPVILGFGCMVIGYLQRIANRRH